MEGCADVNVAPAPAVETEKFGCGGGCPVEAAPYGCSSCSKYGAGKKAKKGGRKAKKHASPKGHFRHIFDEDTVTKKKRSRRHKRRTGRKGRKPSRK